MPWKSIGLGLTCQVEISEDNTGQETMHVKLDPTILHILRDDGFHRAEGQHAGLVDLPPGYKQTITFLKKKTWLKSTGEITFRVAFNYSRNVAQSQQKL